MKDTEYEFLAWELSSKTILSVCLQDNIVSVFKKMADWKAGAD